MSGCKYRFYVVNFALYTHPVNLEHDNTKKATEHDNTKKATTIVVPNMCLLIN